MKIKYIITLCFIAFTQLFYAQNSKDEILFWIDDEPFKVSEFLRVYNKNLDLVKDDSQKEIDKYLDMYVNYQLKIKEAKQLDYDQKPTYKREFRNYKAQLTKNYMSESRVTYSLVKEAYERLNYDVDVSHVLVKFDADLKDTTQVYNQILGLRNKFEAEGFDKLQKSVHNGKTIFAEDLGYFTAFKMVYDFETVAYNTPVGEISQPFRTRFGYHVLKVNAKRKNRGEVTVAHIMVSNKQKDNAINPEKRINEIYQRIEQGEKFEALAAQFSDDLSSSKKGGALKPFSSGQLSSTEFEEAAFALNNEGEVSHPIRTDYGWHIIRLIRKKPIRSFEEMKPELEAKIKRDDRSKLINNALAQDLKKKYDFKSNASTLDYFNSILNDTYFNRGWKIPESFKDNLVLFNFADTTYTSADFGKHLQKTQRGFQGKKLDFTDLVKGQFETYSNNSVISYHESHLAETNAEFAAVLKEYQDGLLLFDLMEDQVWQKAVTDTVGLKNYYLANKNNYVWEDRVDAVIFSGAKKSDLKEVVARLNKGEAIDVINADLNTGKEQKVIVSKNVFETNHPSLPEKLELKKGVSKIYSYNDSYQVIVINEVMPKGPKSFEEAKGKAISDYQNSIETNWINDLKAKSEIKVNETALKNVKTQVLN
ncbi:MAG: peptidylprolyl isomerase [Bacteroidetes bacterium MedPE-SWsnd-G2]|nr:MAG: peptidylprolyl isomerase [Bacteroidetes bacterium MedPE-SWsnd-G2]